ncbi:hypothetical protein DEO72_LG10g1928 [Vigna unguiculata]|uniref:Uncharacterized protein n=1 Tax=Vigna unguiculata TaxID=3917 RepID=A0A4D6NFH6_VIGUN|nr:hypothetical protein DEO72_LG10g1928 [Vigna unguiculata]
MAAAPVGAVVAGACGGVLVRGGCGVVAVMEARTMLQRLRFISGVVVFAATADGGGTGVCWMRLRLVVASEDGAEKTEAARCCCGGDGCASLQVRRREDVCAAGSWWSRTKMVVRELAEKITCRADGSKMVAAGVVQWCAARLAAAAVWRVVGKLGLGFHV